MEKMPEDPKETRYALSDFWEICRKSKKTILLSMLLTAVACSLFALTRNVYYLTSASFRDKGKPHASFRSSLTDYFFSTASISGDSEAMSTLRSKKLMSRIVRKLGVQAMLLKGGETKYPNLEDFRDNLLAEYAYWTEMKVPILKELEKPLKIQDIDYAGEISKPVVIQFTDDTHFKVEGIEEGKPGTGELGKPFKTDEYAFTLIAEGSSPNFKGSSYAIVLLPMETATKIYAAFLVIDVDREDKTLLKLQYKHRDRRFAAEFLNTLMALYQEYLKEDHDFISNFQLNYLRDRQNEMGTSLQDLLKDHASRVSKDLSSSGFMDSEKEMDFLANNIYHLQQQITELDFEHKRLQNLTNFDAAHYDQYVGRGDSSIINSLLGEIRALRQQIDLLDLSLEKKGQSNDLAIKPLLEQQFNELHNTRQYLKEADELTAFLKSDASQSSEAIALLEPPRYLSNAWHESLNEKALNSSEDTAHFKEHFLAYLNNLSRVLQLKEATLQERIKHQHSPDSEFQGITLDMARGLFLNWTSEQNGIQAQVKQHLFVIDELKNPDFEVCSLTALLHDPISSERINKASFLLSNLKDENNRTQKELQRTREELELVKRFLTAHLEQMVELLQLKDKLLSEKIYALQGLTLDLSHQQIYVLKKQLADYIETRLDNLSQEKKLIKDHHLDLTRRMSRIPARWASEKLVAQHLAMHQKFLENLSNMVESKNIAKNLEMIQSMPLDKAVPSINPKPPRAIFYAIIGAVLGLMGSVGFLVSRSLIRGVPATGNNLKLSNLNFSGSLSPASSTSPLLDQDLSTLRKIVGYFDQALVSPQGERIAKKVMLLLGNGPDFALGLSSLIAKKGEKVLELDLSFNEVTPQEKLPGLLQYLEGNAAAPKIWKKGEGIDCLSCGGLSRFSSELLKRQSFRKLLQEVETKYDWVIGISHATIFDAEAANLMTLFDGAIVVLTEESIEEVKEFNETINRASDKAVTFVLA